MSYCDIHGTNNCIECAIEKQTEKIVNAIKELKVEPVKKPSLIDRIKMFKPFRECKL